MDIQTALAHGVEALQAHSPSPRDDARRLLAHVLQCGTARLIAYEDHILDAESERRFRALIGRRQQGEPVAYLTGRQGFWTLDLQVSPGVLIPRPETELLVETALETLPTSAARVLDLGAGSGAVALALAKERPAWEIVATDCSADALKIARQNRDALGLERVRLLQGHWYEPLAGLAPFDLIVSNPPYVAAGDRHLQTGDLRFEPTEALVSGTSGLDALQRIIGGAGAWLCTDGYLLVEHGFDQSASVSDRFRDAGFDEITKLKDYAGHFRAVLGR